MHPARGIKAWEAANLLADEVREAIAHFPRGRRYGVCQQPSEAADSVAANISEGSGRKSVADQIRFYNIALASAQETLTFLKRCWKANLLDSRTYYRLSNLAKVSHSLLAGLIRKLNEQHGA